MDDARAIALKLCAIGVARLGVFAPARFARFFGKHREHGALRCFHLFAGLPIVFHYRLLLAVALIFTMAKAGCLHFFARFAVRDAHDK